MFESSKAEFSREFTWEFLQCNAPIFRYIHNKFLYTRDFLKIPGAIYFDATTFITRHFRSNVVISKDFWERPSRKIVTRVYNASNKWSLLSDSQLQNDLCYDILSLTSLYFRSYYMIYLCMSKWYMYHLLKFYGHIFSIRQSFKIDYLKTDYVISIFKISSRRVVYFASFFRYLYQCVIQQCNKI